MGLHKNNVMHVTVNPMLLSNYGQKYLVKILIHFEVENVKGPGVKPMTFQFADIGKRGNMGGYGCVKENWITAIETYRMMLG